MKNFKEWAKENGYKIDEIEDFWQKAGAIAAATAVVGGVGAQIYFTRENIVALKSIVTDVKVVSKRAEPGKFKQIGKIPQFVPAKYLLNIVGKNAKGKEIKGQINIQANKWKSIKEGDVLKFKNGGLAE
jgi:hypothetical protein